MRRIRGTGMSEHGFDEAVRGVVRGAPWLLTSLLAHLIALMVLWNLRMPLRDHGDVVRMVSEAKEDVPDEIDDSEEPPLPQPPADLEDDPVDVVDPRDDERDEDDIDRDDQQTFADDTGDVDAPFEGVFDNSAIGPGGNAGGGRGGKGGKKSLRKHPKYRETDHFVDLGLQWLADHQDLDGDGRWDCDGFMRHDPPDDRCTGPGAALYDVGVTGLALLAFLGAGHTERAGPDNRFARNVQAGLRYLTRSQDEDGCFGSRSSKHFMYNHAIATLAVCEAYWMSRNPLYRKPAQDGISFISRSRNPYLAWRYEPRGGENDTSVTGWMVMALKAGRWAGLEVDPSAFRGARQWIDKMTDPDFGQCGYNSPGGGPARPEGMQDRFPPERSQSMTAVGMLTRIFLGEDPRESEAIRKGAALCAELPPRWNTEDGSIDMYYWYYATLAMFQVGGKHWKTWNRAMKSAIVRSQHPRGSGSRTGSWDPVGAWGGDGGRVYSTATMVLCLEVYYRYGKAFGTTER